MDYEDFIGMFWEKVRVERYDVNQIALGLALAQLWKEAGFPSRCAVPNEVLCDLLSMSIKPLRAARKRLVEGGVFGFEDGNARRQPIYVFGVPDAVQSAIRFEEPQREVTVRQEKPKVRQRPQKREDERLAIPFPEDKKKKSRKKVTEPEMPSREDVIKECLRKGMTEEEAGRFFDYYNAQGWLTSSGVRIKNVDSMINRWLTNNLKDGYESRRFVQQQRPSAADNIREAQEYIIREMRSHVRQEADGYGGEVPGGLPDY